MLYCPKTPGLGQYSTFEAPECKSAVLSQKPGLGKPGVLGQYSIFEAPECKSAVLSQKMLVAEQKTQDSRISLLVLDKIKKRCILPKASTPKP